MQGDEKRRFCEHCQLHVHNLSAMTPTEQVAVLEEPGDRKCISYMSTPHAKPVDAAMWIRMQSMTGWRKAIAAMLAAAFSMFATNCQTQRTTGAPMPTSDTGPRKLGKMQVKAEPEAKPVATESKPIGEGKMVAGGIMPSPTPWWRKMLFLD